MSFTAFPAPPPAPATPSVTFIIPGHLVITWDEPQLNMGEAVNYYFVNISGPDDLCGNVNTLQMVTERNYSCSGWLPAGQKYTFTVQAANCGGNQRGPDSEPVTVCLQGMLLKFWWERFFYIFWRTFQLRKHL